MERRRQWGTHIALGAGEADTLRMIRRMAEGTAEIASVARPRSRAADLADQIAAPDDRPDAGLLEPARRVAGRPAGIAPKDRSLDCIPTPGHTRGHTASSTRRPGRCSPVITCCRGSPRRSGSRRRLAPRRSPPTWVARRDEGPARSGAAAGTAGDRQHPRARRRAAAHHEQRLDASAAAVACGADTGLEVARELRWTRRNARRVTLTVQPDAGGPGTVAHLQVLVARGRLRAARLDGVDHYQA